MLALLALATILRVVDGDTMHVLDHGRDVTVRVARIDCPESRRDAKCRRLGHDACEAELVRGQIATARAREILHPGDTVTLERTGHPERYHRTLAVVRLADGRDYGQVMLDEGLCELYRRPPRHRRK